MDRMTIKEVADYFGTSKNTIKYRMTKLSPDMTTRDGNVIYILEAGIKELSKGLTNQAAERTTRFQRPRNNSLDRDVEG